MAYSITCDGCGRTARVPVHPIDATMGMVPASWWRVGVLRDDEHRGEMRSAHACSQPCVPAAAMKAAVWHVADAEARTEART